MPASKGMKLACRLSARQYGILAVLVLALLGWVMIDQVFLQTQAGRVVAFWVLSLASLVTYFRLVAPDKPWQLSAHLAVILLGVTVVLGVTMHLAVTWEPEILLKRSWLLWLSVAVLPFLAGWLHSMSRGRSAQR